MYFRSEFLEIWKLYILETLGPTESEKNIFEVKEPSGTTENVMQYIQDTVTEE